MSHYKSNVRDIEFNLFELNRIDEFLGVDPFVDYDRETVMDILGEAARQAGGEFAASFVEADRTPLALVDGEIELPAAVKRSLDAYFEAGWHRLGLSEPLGGQAAPHSVRWAVQEMFIGANPAAYLYVSGILMAAVLGVIGTEEQVKRFAIPMVDRAWGGTMVLTESGAGSDVGAGTTKAIHVDGDVYQIEGTKQFITSAEYDYAENIVHLVLARPEGAPPGTPGLSMFIVPKYMVTEDGSLGERNGVVASNVEKKMGIRGSATCELTFGGERPAVGYLVGGVHNGIKQMFRVIEEARMLIGAKSMSTLSTAYLNALEYARERVQSADLTEATDKTAPRVEIIRHPDVRRMLMTQKAYAEGLRALLLYVAWLGDQRDLHPEESHAARADLLLPMLKGYASEKAYELLGQSLQVFGGAGYLQDHPMEQYIRDIKIDSLYEGTTGIQALDLFFRKIARNRGATLAALGEEIMELVKGGSDELDYERSLLGEALEEAQAQVNAMAGHAMASLQNPPEIYKTGLHANALLESLAEVVIGWLLIRQAEIAIAALADADGAEHDFYEGKLAAARFFVRDALPKARLRRLAAEAEDAGLMDLPDSAF